MRISQEKAYNVLKENANNDKSYQNKNWAYQIKTIFEELGFNNVWPIQKEVDKIRNLK